MSSDSLREPVRSAAASGGPTATVQEVDIRSELRSRPPRRPDHAGEDRALAVLAKEMADNPRNMLQKLVETAVELCRADTAGISLLEGDVFRWEAVAGVFASYRNGTMPRAASPCGTCIDRDTTQLMYLADRAFPALRAEPRFVEAMLLPFHFQGKPVGTVWIVTHNHDRKFDSEDERVVRTLTHFASGGWQLWKAYEAAEEMSQRKDEFMAMLGHELRNPLAAILSATSALQALETTDAGTRHAIEVVGRQGQHLSRMVDDLLDLSRLSQGKLELQTERMELRTIVTHALETTRDHVERRGQNVSVELPAEPVWLEADPVRIVQVLGNLLDNAAKFTPPGGHIRLTTAHADDRVEIAVCDSGIGIPEEHLSGIFDLFKQLGGPGGRSGGGFGLGLTLVRSLVEMHGGTIEAASDGPGKGSRFTVRLPTSVELPQPASPKAAASRVAPIPRRILVVEDNVDVAETFGITLALDGHTVRTAHDGHGALQVVEDFKPDVVFLDVGLPDMSGYDVARRLRQDARRADLRIIALSGYGQDEDRIESKQAGCDAHLVKPVNPDTLRKTLAV